jgi:hypothetical protein
VRDEGLGRGDAEQGEEIAPVDATSDGGCRVVNGRSLWAEHVCLLRVQPWRRRNRDRRQGGRPPDAHSDTDEARAPAPAVEADGRMRAALERIGA